MIFTPYELAIALALGLAALAPVGLYTWSVYNELTARQERLHGLLATARLMKSRRHAVGRAVRQHTRHSARHIEKTTRHAARGKRGGGVMKINADGFPRQENVKLSQRGIEADVQSCTLETNAQVALRREAVAYNTRLRSFPCCLVARWLGFRPWKTHAPTKPYAKRRRVLHASGVQRRRF